MSKKIYILAAVAVVLVAVIIGAGIFVIQNTSANRISRQLDLGQKYLEDCEYEEAIVAFNTVIEIDDRCVEGYIGLTETYIRMGEFEQALEIAKKGYGKTGGTGLEEYISMIESGNISRSDGKWMKMSGFDAAGLLVYYYVLEYDKLGRESAISHYDSNGNLVKRIELAYDEEGNQLVDYTTTIAVGDDAYGELTKRENVWENGKLMGYIGEDGYWQAYEYDESGRRVKWINGHGDTLGKAEDIVDYHVEIYNEAGRRIRSEAYNPNGELVSYMEEEYDLEGAMIMQVYYHGDGSMDYCKKAEYEYDENGSLVSTIWCRYDSEGKKLDYNVNKFDENGKIVASYNYDGDGTLLHFNEYQ